VTSRYVWTVQVHSSPKMWLYGPVQSDQLIATGKEAYK